MRRVWIALENFFWDLCWDTENFLARQINYVTGRLADFCHRQYCEECRKRSEERKRLLKERKL